MPIRGAISAPGYLEGGDFFPMGTDLALLGCPDVRSLSPETLAPAARP